MERMTLNLSDFLALAGFGLTSLAVFSGIVWKIAAEFKAEVSDCNSNIEILRQKISTVDHGAEGARRRIYERLDEVKKTSEEKYVRKDILEVMQVGFNASFRSFTSELEEIKRDVKQLLIRSGKGTGG